MSTATYKNPERMKYIQKYENLLFATYMNESADDLNENVLFNIPPEYVDGNSTNGATKILNGEISFFDERLLDWVRKRIEARGYNITTYTHDMTFEQKYGSGPYPLMNESCEIAICEQVIIQYDSQSSDHAMYGALLDFIKRYFQFPIKREKLRIKIETIEFTTKV